MPTNQFLPFGIDPAANVIADADYASPVWRMQGFTAGVAQSEQLNKVWRQGSVVASTIGRFINDLTGEDALDNGDIDTLLANFKAAIRSSLTGAVDQSTFRTVTSGPVQSPPASPATGAEVLVADSPSGAFTGHARSLALWDGTQWQFSVVRAGRIFRVGETGTYWSLSSSSGWVAFTIPIALVSGLQTALDGKLNNTGDTITGVLNFGGTGSAQAISFGGSRMLHQYAGANADGFNTFVGSLAGNFTTTGAPGSTFQGSRNVAFGASALPALSTGYENVAIGQNAFGALSTGFYNVGVGRNVGLNLTTGDRNTLVGYGAGGGITTGRANTLIGGGMTSLASSLSNNVIIADGDGNQRIRADSAGLYANGLPVVTAGRMIATAAGSYLIGGGDLSADRSLALDLGSLLALIMPIGKIIGIGVLAGPVGGGRAFAGGSGADFSGVTTFTFAAARATATYQVIGLRWAVSDYNTGGGIIGGSVLSIAAKTAASFQFTAPRQVTIAGGPEQQYELIFFVAVEP